MTAPALVTATDSHRDAGVLLHPTSLPSGRLDDDAYRWIDWLAEAGFGVWQMLPLGVPLVGLSPYQCASAFALNPKLFAERDELDTGRYGDVYTQWYEQNQAWVDDYALFMTLKHHFNGDEWVAWPALFRNRDAGALQRFSNDHQPLLERVIHKQFHVWQQFKALRAYAHDKGIRLFGDMPIFVAHDSADVWAHPDLFLLDDAGQPTVVAGVPPDYFSETGQRWGNPHYRWDVMQADDFHWWKERLRYHFDGFDLVRIDHFRGLQAVWTIAADCDTAIEGHWETVPGAAFLQSLQDHLGDVPLVAEDLGVITPEVTALRDQFALPGMAVLQFGFDYFDDNPHKPQNVIQNTVYYTGTHDNDTTYGWFSQSERSDQQRIMEVLGIDDEADEAQVVNAMVDTVMSSEARLVIVPMQDLLHLGSEARMNTPGTVDGNWTWQFQWQQVSATLASELQNTLRGHQRTGVTSG